MTEAIVPFLIGSCIFLVLTAAIYRFSRKFILPAVTLMMILGAISGIIPITISDSDRLFYFFTTEFSDLILLVFIPLLIFESGRKLKLAELKKEAVPIGFFAIIGMVVTIFLIGIPFGFIFNVPLLDALLFGAILAATDPVAIGAIFTRFPIPHRLNVIIEGESLFNDGTCVISVNLLKNIIFLGVAYSLLGATLSLLWSLVGAILLGTVLGWLTARLSRLWKDDELVVPTITVALAIGSYLIADQFLHVSGVVASLFAALVFVYTEQQKLSKTERLLFHSFWDYLGFMTNSLLFFLVGIPLIHHFFDIEGNWLAVCIIPIVIVFISRAIVVYGGSSVLRIFRVKIPVSWQNVLTLGGIRGGIAVALVLSLPATYPYKEIFVMIIGILIAINLVLNPILLHEYLKKTKLAS
ncbi:MAG: Na(+)/H(+) antiporter 1 [Candidatus Methanophagaceae archaeon]|nr:MAG: Na(+)/H(+) antiporter 1 [Methanophagales archaeon]KAF5433073.1 monovalent cation:H+ antiporter, CPA1 family [Methanophagales archaeon]